MMIYRKTVSLRKTVKVYLSYSKTDINAYQVFPFPVMVVEQFKLGLMLLFDAQKDIFDFFGGNVVVALLQLTIYPIYRRFGVVDKRIGSDGCLARLHIPTLGTHIAFHTETHFLAVHGDPVVERNHSVGFLFVYFQEKENFEGTSLHKKLIF
jgi:hypothetical protein